MSEEEQKILDYIKEHGIVDLEQVQAELDMKKNQELLNKHPYTIYQGKDGKFYTYLPDDKKGRVFKKRASKEALESLVINYWKQQEENPTVQEIFDEYNNRRLELGKIIPATYTRDKQIFNRHYSEMKDKRIKSISPEYMEDFLEKQLFQHQLTSKAFSNLRSVTRGFFKRARKRKLIPWRIEDVFTDLEYSSRDFKKVIKEDYQEVFDETETALLLEYLYQNLDLRNIGILLMLITGIRVGELSALKIDDFDGNTIKIRRTSTRYRDKNTNKYVYAVKEFPKTEAGVRCAIIPPDFTWIVEKLKLHVSPDGFVFYENGKMMNTYLFRNRLRKICSILGIYNKSPHKLRKTYGSILIDNKLDQRFIINLMGHTEIACTEAHYHRNRKSLDKKTAILGSIPEFQKK